MGVIVTRAAKLAITGTAAVLAAVLIAFGFSMYHTANHVSTLQRQASRASRVITAQAKHIQQLDASVATQQRDMAKTQAVLASIGKPTQTDHLGLCVNYSEQGTDSDEDTYTYEDVEPAGLSDGVVSCSSGTFVSVVPGPGGNDGN
jgi:hypothetical protein